MKVSVEDIKNVKPGKPLISVMNSRLEATSCRNLVSYVNSCYPKEGWRYSVHVTKENVVHISLVENKDK